ncbi:DinB family protein [Prauserella shujinwangii]|uniref:DinB family protein n=1 Tax=Prauserella shujinwangii TaxID=1453103 RepID=A0A2T0LLL2_9PSEU|nr:DinB family protein [Prauserella shujinwangii]PRX43925.1 DinB family protein [Prauserella shujinwangii]
MITPDTKDWTWVLRRTCPECGFDASSITPRQVPAMLRVNAASWRQLLTAGADVRTRPRPDKWSPLEYACHVRDVFRIYDDRLVLMLTEDDPAFPNWDQDETAVAERYGEQDPRHVADELAEAAETLAARFERVNDDQWQRTGTRSDGAHFTVDTFARYFIHDPVHHWHDVTPERL